ncbi:LPS export ABC transporter permease LptG [Endozoicomonas sp. SM1973]|uniref:LPS export ABC transporter permease LptG n=1 Tax=Spartinivicinus marinus TaxID=2994442 RepID=A0A853HZD7_9GAMM|nr:LPS export ABC transporter permease LptG [Spartinivicinus marinus]MCX4025736.1 LPS export ABC transporter permease LptG [Spartinivicinus marinus]NYZ65729.1 LPS export ABC transporter permease LptG [Spartinivicinus marinus]
MNKIDRYIATSVLSATFLVLLVIVSLDMLFAFVAELASMKASYQLLEVLQYIGLSIPNRIYKFIPFSALIGCLVGLGALASNSELVVMRAAGVSLWRIVWGVMQPTLLIILIGISIGEFVSPYTEQLADSGRAIARSKDGSSSQFSQQGVWHREGNEFMHLNAVEPGGIVHGITRFKFNDKKELLEASFADRGIFKGDYWLLQNIQSNQFKGDRVTTERLPFLQWQTSLSMDLLNVVVVKPDDLSIRGLSTYIDYLSQQGLNAGEYQLAFWRKLLQPAVIIGLVLVGISFVFGPLRSVTMGLRIFIGVIVGFSFNIFQELLGPSSLVFGFSPLIAVIVPLLLCFTVGGILLKRAG